MMNWIMAWRNIWRNPLRSIVIMLSVALGLFCGILVLAIYKGMMNGRLKTVIESETGHLQIHAGSFKPDYDPAFLIPNAPEIVSYLQNNPVCKGFAIRSITQGMLSTTTGSAGVQINGINYNREKEISGLDKKIIMGDGLLVNQKQSILIGKKLADKLKLKTGKKLVLTFTDTASNLVSAAFRVASLYRSDNAPFDEKNVYIEQGMLNELLGIRNGVHEIVVLLKDDNQTEYVKNLLTEKFPSLQIETWKALSPETDLLINTVDVYAYIIIIIILLALSFGIINTMMMAVLERSHEIGMLMALGMDKKKIFSMIMAETVLLTLTGTPLGLGLSQILVHYYHMHGMDWSGMGKEMMSSFGFSSIIYPQYPNEKIPIVIAMVIITALFSCILPALRALNLTPIAALRK